MNEDEIKTQYVGKFLENDYNKFKDGLLELLEDYKRKSQRLDKIIKQSDKMQLRLIKANEELAEYKNNLEKKVEEEILKRKEKEKIILEQSKFAAMGEMIDAIAHQWTQPLSILSLYSNSLEFDYKEGIVDEAYIDDFQKKVNATIEHMNCTLTEFRTFFREDKKREEFDIKTMIEKVFLFVKDEFIKEKITLTLKIDNDFKIIGIENEFKHILLNLINNSKDAFIVNKIKEREIIVKAYVTDDSKVLEISDNAGGIPFEILDEIFKANFTTKENSGTGIGLYMSSLIAQKYHCKLFAKNIEKGAQFKLIIN